MKSIYYEKDLRLARHSPERRFYLQSFREEHNEYLRKVLLGLKYDDLFNGKDKHELLKTKTKDFGGQNRARSPV